MSKKIKQYVLPVELSLFNRSLNKMVDSTKLGESLFYNMYDVLYLLDVKP